MTQTLRQREPAVQFDSYDCVNLGCGDDYRDGDSWLNVDLRTDGHGMNGERVAPDFAWDLNDLPWPFPTDNFRLVEMHNVLEHLDDHLSVLEELHRVTRPGGKVVVSGPHWNSASAWIDPTHTRPFDPRTFGHYLVEDLFTVDSIEVETVRWANLLPDRVALWFADILGHGVVEFTVTVTVEETP